MMSFDKIFDLTAGVYFYFYDKTSAVAAAVVGFWLTNHITENDERKSTPCTAVAPLQPPNSPRLTSQEATGYFYFVRAAVTAVPPPMFVRVNPIGMIAL